MLTLAKIVATLAKIVATLAKIVATLAKIVATLAQSVGESPYVLRGRPRSARPRLRRGGIAIRSPRPTAVCAT
ncbi:MAG: hypothetical protein ACYC4U_09165, partial [Pirellulaceae bacterium]